MEQDNIQEIINKINELGEQLSTRLRDDIYLRIDNKDNVSIQRGADLLKKLNSNFEDFHAIMKKINNQIEESDKPISRTIVGYDEDVEKELLGKYKSHSITENFDYKKPYGFILENVVAKKGITKWADLYTDVLSALYRSNESRFVEMVQEYNGRFTDRNSHKKEKKQSKSRQIERSGIFVMTHSSTKQKIGHLKEFLAYFGISFNSMKIFLRQ